MNKSDSVKWAECYNNIHWIDEQPWFLDKKILEPISLPHMLHKVNRNKLRETIFANNALLAYWTDNWDGPKSEWWWTCCDDKNYDIENIKSSRGRRSIRKGLRECTVRKINPKDFTEMAYDVYKKSLLSFGYDNSKIDSKIQFEKNTLRKCNYEGYELWGAFVQKKLVAYATPTIIDNAAILGNTYSDSDFNNQNPNSALFYEITKHFLCERKLSFVSNGHRSLIPHTSINEFLERMGYRKIYGRLNVEFSPFAKNLSYFASGNSGKLISLVLRSFNSSYLKFRAFGNLVNISKTFTK